MKIKFNLIFLVSILFSFAFINNYSFASENTTIETIPSNIIAKMFAFEKAELFKIDENKKENIKENFNQ